MQFVPTKHIVSTLERFGMSWPDLVDDLNHANRQPMIGYPTRQRWLGEKLQAYIEPGTYQGEDVFFVVGVRLRCSSDEPAPVQVVGIETQAVKSRKRGGAGRVWPSTWGELEKRIEAHPGLRVLPGNGGHRIVYRNGKQVDVLPTSSSDYRALRNACLQLKRRGIDVRRVQTRALSPTG